MRRQALDLYHADRKYEGSILPVLEVREMSVRLDIQVSARPVVSIPVNHSGKPSNAIPQPCGSKIC